MKHKLIHGWQPDLPDHRDMLYTVPRFASLPTAVDLRHCMPAVYDQGQLGSCTANAIAGAMEYDQFKQGKPEFTPSRLFIYFNERKMEHTIQSDSGAQIRDGIKSVASLGVCPETMWPYDVNRFRTPPSAKCYRAGLNNTALHYRRVPASMEAIRAALASSFPVVFGFTVYESFESARVAKTGRLLMPTPGEKVLGGHAVLAVGYSDDENAVLVRNSWGANWGMEGYFKMPYEYISDPNLADDRWVIQSIK